MHRVRLSVFLVIATNAVFAAAPALAQTNPAPPQHQHGQETATAGWHLMQDGVIYGLFNHQGGPRGGQEFVAPNWWMGMASRDAGRHRFTFSGMLSLDAALVGRSGYRELFQSGEALDGELLVDRQHPHDFLMQLAATWRVALRDNVAFSAGGGPSAEPTLGPVAFMHRASAAGLPFAPLGHHTFDSTHVSFGVVAAGLEAGRWTIEGSLFNGREPDDNRWDLDLGQLDSAAGRVWFRPSAEWALQVSTGLLRDPEELEPGDVRRTTASAAWTRTRASGFVAVTSGWGMNAAHGTNRHGVFGEFTTEWGPNAISSRLEIQQLEVDALLGHEAGHDEGAATLTAVTVSASRRFILWRGWDLAVGAQGTAHVVPEVLKPSYGSSPLSAQVFVRVLLPTGPMGRMWNHRMLGGH